MVSFEAEGRSMSQQRVREALQAAEGYLSGEELSRGIGITRAAVWKAVENLRRQGYDIEARTGKGYRLRQSPDLLRRETVEPYLTARRENWQVLETVDSTNSLCRRLALEGAPDGTAVLADCQTAGRGRRGRSFQSAAGKGLFFSVLWRPHCPPEKLLPLTALSAVATCRAIRRVCGAEAQIKWPNDLVLGGKKLAGILTEMALEGESGEVSHVVVGIGINVHQKKEDFQGEVGEIATSLDRELGGSICRGQLAAALLEEMDLLRREVLLAPEKWLEEYRSACLNVGCDVQLLRDEERQRVHAVAVDEQFGLVVRHEDGQVETVRSGEVSVRGLYGYAE